MTPIAHAEQFEFLRCKGPWSSSLTIAGEVVYTLHSLVGAERVICRCSVAGGPCQRCKTVACKLANELFLYLSLSPGVPNLHVDPAFLGAGLDTILSMHAAPTELHHNGEANRIALPHTLMTRYPPALLYQ